MFFEARFLIHVARIVFLLLKFDVKIFIRAHVIDFDF